MMYNTWGVNMAYFREKVVFMPKNACFLPNFIAKNLNRSTLESSSYIFLHSMGIILGHHIDMGCLRFKMSHWSKGFIKKIIEISHNKKYLSLPHKNRKGEFFLAKCCFLTFYSEIDP